MPKPATMDEYLFTATGAKRVAFDKLLKAIRSICLCLVLGSLLAAPLIGCGGSAHKTNGGSGGTWPASDAGAIGSGGISSAVDADRLGGAGGSQTGAGGVAQSGGFTTTAVSTGGGKVR